MGPVKSEMDCSNQFLALSNHGKRWMTGVCVVTNTQYFHHVLDLWLIMLI
ncbi:MAG: hypothetical protein ACYTBV_11950 [Planctomycetota bacterium]